MVIVDTSVWIQAFRVGSSLERPELDGLLAQELMRHVLDCGGEGVTISFPDKLSEYLDSI